MTITRKLPFWLLVALAMLPFASAENVLGSTLRMISDTLGPRGIGEAYMLAPYLWDSILVLILFIFLSKTALKHLHKGVGIIIAIILAIGFGVFEVSTGFTFARLAPAAAFITFGVLTFAVYGWVAGASNNKTFAFASAFALMFYTIIGYSGATSNSSVRDYFAQYATIWGIMSMLAAFSLIYVVVYLVRRLFGGRGPGGMGWDNSPAGQANRSIFGDAARLATGGVGNAMRGKIANMQQARAAKTERGAQLAQQARQDLESMAAETIPRMQTAAEAARELQGIIANTNEFAQRIGAMAQQPYDKNAYMAARGSYQQGLGPYTKAIGEGAQKITHLLWLSPHLKGNEKLSAVPVKQRLEQYNKGVHDRFKLITHDIELAVAQDNVEAPLLKELDEHLAKLERESQAILMEIEDYARVEALSAIAIDFNNHFKALRNNTTDAHTLFAELQNLLKPSSENARTARSNLELQTKIAESVADAVDSIGKLAPRYIGKLSALIAAPSAEEADSVVKTGGQLIIDCGRVQQQLDQYENAQVQFQQALERLNEAQPDQAFRKFEDALLAADKSSAEAASSLAALTAASEVVKITFEAGDVLPDVLTKLSEDGVMKMTRDLNKIQKLIEDYASKKASKNAAANKVLNKVQLRYAETAEKLTSEFKKRFVQSLNETLEALRRQNQDVEKSVEIADKNMLRYLDDWRTQLANSWEVAIE